MLVAIIYAPDVVSFFNSLIHKTKSCRNIVCFRAFSTHLAYLVNQKTVSLITLTWTTHGISIQKTPCVTFNGVQWDFTLQTRGFFSMASRLKNTQYAVNNVSDMKLTQLNQIKLRYQGLRSGTILCGVG